MVWSGRVLRGIFNGIGASKSVHVFGKNRLGKLVLPVDIVLDSLTPRFVGAPILDASSQKTVGTIDSYVLSSNEGIPAFITVSPLPGENFNSVPDAFVSSDPILNGTVKVQLIRGGAITGITKTTGTLTSNLIQNLPFPNLGNPNKPAYLADTNSSVNDDSHGSRVLLEDNTLLGMLYLSDNPSGGITSCRIFPAAKI